MHDLSNISAFTIDAQKIYEECSYAAFETLVKTDHQMAKEKWIQMLNGDNKSKIAHCKSNIPFCGAYKDAHISDFTFLGLDFENISDIQKLKHSELVKGKATQCSINEEIFTRKSMCIEK